MQQKKTVGFSLYSLILASYVLLIYGLLSSQGYFMRTDVELLRIVSAFGIVWFHSGLDLGKDIAYSGLIVFLILTSYFSLKSKNKHSPLSRFFRFIIPCVVWSVFFALFNLIRGEALFPEDYHFISKLLSTPSIHLWYLPFAFFCVVSLEKIKNYDHQTLSILTTLLFTILLIFSPIWREWAYISPLGQYMHALPAILLGIIFACYDFLDKAVKRVIYFLLFLAFCNIVYFGLPGISKTYTIGFLASLMLLKNRSFLSDNEKILKLSQLTFGIFLVHPLFLFIVRHFGITSIMLPITAFLLSMLTIFIMLKVLPRRVSKYIA